MRFYTYGFRSRPVILLIPGTCCHHSMFDAVIPLLTERFFAVVASFSGFDERAEDEYQDMVTETEAIEQYIREKLEGHIACCYGCSLGGSFAAFLVQRGNVKIDHVILGSSDLDEAGGLSARFQSFLIANIMYGMLKKGKLPGWMARINDAKIRKHPEEALYRSKFTAFFLTPALKGGVVSKKSIYNQFYSDLVTKLDDDIFREGTMIHVFYAEKMGAEYERRYRKHFRKPDIRSHDMFHEELLACYPELWRDEVTACYRMREE